MKKSILTILFLIVILSTNAQQNLFGPAATISPEINNNNSVTFSIKAPDAKSIILSGDWQTREGFRRITQSFEKENDSIWSVTTESLAPELYTYSFSVDGVRTIDPNNAHAFRDVANISNYFIISGALTDLYTINNVP